MPNDPKELLAPNGFTPKPLAPLPPVLPPNGAVDVGAPKMPLVGVFVLSTANALEFCPKPLNGVVKDALDWLVFALPSNGVG